MPFSKAPTGRLDRDIDILRAAGCDLGQGSTVNRADAFERFAGSRVNELSVYECFISKDEF
jgi:hypothetical protein